MFLNVNGVKIDILLVFVNEDRIKNVSDKFS